VLGFEMKEWQSDTILDLKGIGKVYGSIPVLESVDFSLREREFAGLIGPNGAGKTTLLEIVEGVNEPTFGNITLVGERPDRLSPRHKWRVGLMFQRQTLPGYLKVHRLVSLFQRLIPGADTDADLLVQLGLSNLLSHKVAELSAGQRQRLSIYLAIAGQRDFLLLDEPTSTLDLRSREAVWTSLLGRKSRGSLAGLMATHNLAEAALLCDRLYFLNRGRICAQGRTADFCTNSGRGMFAIKFNAPSQFIQSWAFLSSAAVTLDKLSNSYELTCPRDRLPAAISELLDAEQRMGFDASLTLSERGLEEAYLEIYERAY
jgi:ABC-2 type transport system ATP-binding protein